MIQLQKAVLFCDLCCYRAWLHKHKKELRLWIHKRKTIENKKTKQIKKFIVYILLHRQIQIQIKMFVKRRLFWMKRKTHISKWGKNETWHFFHTYSSLRKSSVLFREYILFYARETRHIGNRKSKFFFLNNKHTVFSG